MTATAPPPEDALIATLPRLRRYALVLTGALQQADDLVVDTLAYAREAQHPRQHHAALLTWLFMLMHELHVNESSRRPDSHAAMPRRVEHRPVQRRISGAVTRPRDTAPAQTLDRFFHLPVVQREMLLLVAVEGLSYGEIATLLGVPVATVISRLNRARANLAAVTGEPPLSGDGSI